MTGWVKHAVWWHLYPLGFTGAPVHGWDGRPQSDLHRIAKIEEWFDYALELGASGIALGPVFESEKHGYDTRDYFHVDGRLGTDEDIDSLIAAAHGRGLKIMFDGVFNHVAQSFPKYRQALAEGPRSESAQWFHLDWSGDEPTHRNFEGHDELVALNHESEHVQQYVVDVLSHWLGRGVDAWRLDAAYAVSPRFWAAVLPRVREKYPDAYFLGEVIHGDYDRIVSSTTLDSVTQYELWKAIWSGLSELNFFELAHALERHNGWLDAFVPATFVGNHDVNRIASVIEDERHLVHALVILFTVGGMPMIYYGDEQAFRGIKEERVGGDDEVRPQYPDSPDGLAPYGWPIYRIHQELIGLRRRNPWLYAARTRTLELTNTALLYRADAEGESVTVALNLGDEAIDYPVEGGVVLAGDAHLAGGRVTVNPHGWAIIG